MLSEDFLLTNETGKRLYHQYAEGLPIIDFHCHLLPEEILEDRVFEDIGDIWLRHDHYKWRAMRTFGIGEEYITGTQTSFYEKFRKFAAVMPLLAGNPIYIWCALELKRYFGIDEPLSDETADEIYRETGRVIREQKISPRTLIAKSNVEFICTTSDPVENLETHEKLRKTADFRPYITAAFRPDTSFYLERAGFAAYIQLQSAAVSAPIGTFRGLMAALEQRMQFFRRQGSLVADLSVESVRLEPAEEGELDAILQKALQGRHLSERERNQYRWAFLIGFGRLCFRQGFVMQLHVGTYKGANSYMDAKIGPATGYDCTDDQAVVKSIGAVLDALETARTLPKTILYPLNINHLETFAILAAAFCGGPAKARGQLGAPWWFNDQVYGLDRYFESVANLYPISLSVGMLTDSRSFLSYPRFEVYRRVFCNYLGGLVERGEYFSDERYLREIITGVCYRNAKDYFGLSK